VNRVFKERIIPKEAIGFVQWERSTFRPVRLPPIAEPFYVGAKAVNGGENSSFRPTWRFSKRLNEHRHDNEPDTRRESPDTVRLFFETPLKNRSGLLTTVSPTITSFECICRIADIGVKGRYEEAFSSAVSLLAASGPSLIKFVELYNRQFLQLPTDNLDIVISAIGRADGVETSRRFSLIERFLRVRSEPTILESCVDAIGGLAQRYLGVRERARSVLIEICVQTAGKNGAISSLAEEILGEDWNPVRDFATAPV
jgi:hypothetical protein